jgi:ribosomal protein S18 acetylase RimI-like enzyme
MIKDDQTNLKIVELNLTNVTDINRVDSAFEVKSRIAPYMKEGEFGYTLEEVPVIYKKSYRNDEFDYTTYLGNPNKTAYLVYINSEVVGQISLSRWWNKLAWIEDIRVESKYRRAGIGKKLVDAAVRWARENEMSGIMLETQDTNVAACLLYQQYGFTLGGVDRMLYRGTENSSETALFWYFIF